MSDADSDCETNPVRTVKQGRNKMKILIFILLFVALTGIATAVPVIVLTNFDTTTQRESRLITSWFWWKDLIRIISKHYSERKKPQLGYLFCASTSSVVYEMTEFGLPRTTEWKTDSEENEVVTYDFPYFSRSDWGAREAKETLPLSTPVPYVVIHHSSTPAACYNKQECEKAMKSMQNFHMDDRRWWDIGYNFAVGSDGAAYEGRGWSILGAHALHFNTVSIGICVIGDWTNSAPPAGQLKTVKALIAAGVEQGYIKPSYKLVGHRQVRDTECPGQSFFDVVKTWDHWSPFPASHLDLINVPEISEDEKNRFLRKS